MKNDVRDSYLLQQVKTTVIKKQLLRIFIKQKLKKLKRQKLKAWMALSKNFCVFYLFCLFLYFHALTRRKAIKRVQVTNGNVETIS